MADYAVHPGEVLAEKLAELGMSQREFATRTGLTPKHINRIIRGHAGYRAATAIRFERVTGMSATLWLQLQANYQTAKARQQ